MWFFYTQRNSACLCNAVANESSIKVILNLEKPTRSFLFITVCYFLPNLVC